MHFFETAEQGQQILIFGGGTPSLNEVDTFNDVSVWFAFGAGAFFFITLLQLQPGVAL